MAGHIASQGIATILPPLGSFKDPIRTAEDFDRIPDDHHKACQPMAAEYPGCTRWSGCRRRPKAIFGSVQKSNRKDCYAPSFPGYSAPLIHLPLRPARFPFRREAQWMSRSVRCSTVFSDSGRLCWVAVRSWPLAFGQGSACRHGEAAFSSFFGMACFYCRLPGRMVGDPDRWGCPCCPLRLGFRHGVREDKTEESDWSVGSAPSVEPLVRLAQGHDKAW